MAAVGCCDRGVRGALSCTAASRWAAPGGAWKRLDRSGLGRGHHNGRAGTEAGPGRRSAQGRRCRRFPQGLGAEEHVDRVSVACQRAGQAARGARGACPRCDGLALGIDRPGAACPSPGRRCLRYRPHTACSGSRCRRTGPLAPAPTAGGHGGAGQAEAEAAPASVEHHFRQHDMGQQRRVSFSGRSRPGRAARRHAFSRPVAQGQGEKYSALLPGPRRRCHGSGTSVALQLCTCVAGIVSDRVKQRHYFCSAAGGGFVRWKAPMLAIYQLFTAARHKQSE